jgi:hypothetical protein
MERFTMGQTWHCGLRQLSGRSKPKPASDAQFLKLNDDAQTGIVVRKRYDGTV